MRRLASVSAAFFLVAACGGKVLDEGSPAGVVPTSTATSGPTSSPPSTGAPAPTSLPPLPTSAPTSSPVSPVPAGKVGQCGLYDGDAEANLKAFGLARAVGVYRAVEVAEECSGAGGTHVTLVRVDGCSSARVVHYGEHACFLEWQVGDVFAIGVAPEPGKTENPGWCIDGLEWDGVARAVRKLDDGETTAAALARYGCTP